jgi:hypothetical protein
MITKFYIEEAYIRFNSDSYKKSKLNGKINNYISVLIKNKKYVIEENNYYITIIDIKNGYINCDKYITELYYDKYKKIYDKLYQLKICNNNKYEDIFIKPLETYIHTYFRGRNILNNYDFNIKLNKKNIHNKINIDKLNFINKMQTKGTLIDYCIKYIINNDYDYAFDYLLKCNKSIDYDNLPNNLDECSNSIDLINLLFEDDFKQKILEINKYFTNVKTTECYVNFDFKIYGEPDLIADDYIIDIKTSENNKIVSKENIKQILFYAIVAGKKNICLYDPINGNLYEYNLTDDDINNAKKFINGDYKPKEIIDNYIV